MTDLERQLEFQARYLHGGWRLEHNGLLPCIVLNIKEAQNIIDRLEGTAVLPYDSRPDTYAHISQVRRYLMDVIHDLVERVHKHDKSKLEEPELSVFNEFTPKLENSVYGSDEYREFLEAMKEGLKHHYEINDHHPEHFPNGIADMDLLQVTEMLCDWKAATLRHKHGDLKTSIQINTERFGYGSEMERLLMNTAKNFGWL